MGVTSIWAVTLVILVSASTLQQARCKTQLNPNSYGSVQKAQSCLAQTWNEAMAQLDAQTGPNCLRMAFHDAGTYSTATDTGGADGSILSEIAQGLGPSGDLSPCAGLVNTAIQTLRGTADCSKLTAADAIQVFGAAAVAKSGGPVCNMLMGRPDASGPDPQANIGNLPQPCDTTPIGIGRFTTMGFSNPTTAYVVLSGAHNIGSAVTGSCSKGDNIHKLPMTASPNSFDGHYYNEVVQGTGNGGWFVSDRDLNNSPATSGMAQAFAANHGAFLSSWCGAYQEMSMLGVNPGAFSVGDNGWNPTATPTSAPTPTPTTTPNPTPTPTPAVSLNTISSCTTTTSCPTDQAYFFCLAGNAAGGCRPGGPFPSADCAQQCSTGNIGPVPVSGTPTPTPPSTPNPAPTPAVSLNTASACGTTPTGCPTDQAYFFCMVGNAAGGCRPGSPFPSADCAQQCSTGNIGPVQVSGAPTPTPPSTPTPTPAVNTISSCTSTTGCPADRVYFFCMAGTAIGGCSPVNPFPSVDCTQQCTTGIQQ